MAFKGKGKPDGQHMKNSYCFSQWHCQQKVR
jgi:hypothetical protein